MFASIGGAEDFLATSVRLSIPIVFAAIGGVFSERSGVYNIGLEGMILLGAFGAAVGSFFSGQPLVGLVVGASCGFLGGLLLSFLNVILKVDQFVSGIAVNILCLGLTAFLARTIFQGQGNTTILAGFEKINIWPFSNLPIVGKVIFGQDLMIYLAYLLIPASWFVLTKTKWGLFIRAAGDDPLAADSSGIPVNRLRFCCVTLSCVIASLGGCYLVLSQVFVFSEHMSAGKGFVALAAIILGRWKPVWILSACLFFGVCDALQLRLQFENPDIPYQAFVILPYVASIVAIVVLAGKSRAAPEAIGKPYTRGSN